MNVIIESSLQTLKKSKILLDSLTDNLLSDSSVSPYHSSIGSHIRHILDFYDCIFNINSNNEIDLTARRRHRAVELECSCAIQYLDSIIDKLTNFEFDMTDSILVTDDLGLGKVEMVYSYGALFSQANSHTIHHYAIINYILEGLNISIKDSDFGYNPTTPKQTSLN
ncbi:hypothetical protein CJ739_24 [Mariniflexile rhizosphaerae]|uniref:DinB family protein n=1 Tax=unclassified Mariniflexile TaxID=2643887 RepID=UPI000CB021EB|nr:DinB family protein [Mariniflexile sp. TRM1-10]AXP79130.1 hypothetical protein CJ739_24 [Mariniflexile sp. TRM1-10]PLB18702.1 MAG: DinB_2 domain containing protein [Flavobacteriaceae bacterium FS1-H7996/R]